MPIRNRFADLLPELIAWRHDFHAHPELMFDTHRTAARVAELLREFGVDEVVEGIGRTGVVGIIRGTRDSQGRVIGLRADMDALPIEEAVKRPHGSTVPGCMHACGHDGHMTMLLGAARYLSETRNFDGTAIVVFQPAEEGGGGGREMCADGLMERFGIQEIYGMHNWPGMQAGSFAIRPGPFFAAADQFEIEVEGRGGHAARPHEAIDTTLVAAQIVVALQGIVSRNIDPTAPAVVSITSFETDSTAYNVIPQRALLKGTVRSLDQATRALAQERLGQIAHSVAEAFGARAVLNYMPGYPVMVNAPEQTEFAAQVARAVAGECADAPLIMAGEDFAYMLEERPGAYILVGNGPGPMLHHPEYDFNDEIMPAGCSFWAELVERRMPL